MSTFRRRLPKAFKVKGRSPEDYSQEFQEFVDQSVLIGEGRPAGFEEVDPTPIQAGTTADPGDPSDGWMSASAIIPVETAAPSHATGTAAAEGTGTALMRADATILQGIVTTKGDLLGFSSVPAAVPIGSNDQILIADSAQTLGLKWGANAPSYPLLAPNGSAGAPSYSFANDTDTGWFLSAVGSMRAVVGAVARIFLDGSSSDLVGPGSSASFFSAGTNKFSIVGGTTTAPTDSTIIAASNSTSGGAGGDLALRPGSGTVGTANGGNLTLTGGDPAGAGLRGRILVPSTTWLQQAISRKMLTSNYTNATATFSNTALSIDVVTGRKYLFELVLICSESVAAEGIQIDFNGGSAAATNFIASGDVSDTVAAGVIQETTTLAGTISLATITGASRVTVKGSFEPSSTGTFIVRAAQNTHATGTLTIKRGSWLLMEDVA